MLKGVWELLGALWWSAELAKRVRCNDWSGLSSLSFRLPGALVPLLLLLARDDCDAAS